MNGKLNKMKGQSIQFVIVTLKVCIDHPKPKPNWYHQKQKLVLGGLGVLRMTGGWWVSHGLFLKLPKKKNKKLTIQFV